MHPFWKKRDKAEAAPTKPASESSSSAIRWVLPNQLAVGPFPRATAHAKLTQAGIQTVLTLCSEPEGMLSPEIQRDFHCLRFPLPDSHYTETLERDRVIQAAALVRHSIEQQQPIYVHCVAAMERSPTVCIAYLCLYEQMEPWKALNWLKQVNPSTSLISAQVELIQSLKSQC